MLIRTYDANDLDKVVALWKSCGLVVPWNNPERDIARKLTADPDLFLVGIVGDEVVASVMGGYDGHRGWINYLAVHPEMQRGGFGRRIVERLEELLKLRGCPKINLQVRTNNKDVIAFYSALGFGVDDVLSMGKRLENDEE